MYSQKTFKTKWCIYKKAKGILTINDLELLGLVLGWLMLEYVVGYLTFTLIGSFCDNIPSVVWAYIRSTLTSIPEARLLCFLALQQLKRKASSPTPMIIAVKDNAMADIPSRAFRDEKFAKSQKNLTSYFKYHSPLSQNQSRKEYSIPTK